MPTLGESPDAKKILTDIKPNEVSVVDEPANGEPFVVVKNLSSSDKSNNNGGNMLDKIDENSIPRTVMKIVCKRVSNAIDSINELQNVVKRMNVHENGDNKAPGFLVGMTKSVASELRSLQPGELTNEQDIKKRVIAESVLSLQDITKREEDINKANAVSYLVRDQWIDVTTSISEWMTTYVDGIETDDVGPILIPDNLDSTIEKSACELEKLVDEHTDKDDNIENYNENVTKRIEDTFDIRGEFDKVIKAVEEIKSDFTSFVKSQENENMSEKVTEKSTLDEKETKEDVSTDDSNVESKPVEKTDSDLILKAIAGLEKKFNEKFENVEKSINEVRELANSTTKKVDKAMKSRVDPRGNSVDDTTKVTEKSKSDEGSFSNILGLKGI